MIIIKALEEKIKKDGKVLPGDILQVSNFLNHQIDPNIMREIGIEIARLYKDTGVTKILTVESSGVAIALAAALEMNVPFVFAKKGHPSNISKDTYSAEVRSFTKGNVNRISVSREYLNSTDKVLIVDDFLAKGEALNGLISIAEDAGATVAGAAIAIEKGYQGGGDQIRSRGIRVESLAIVDKMYDDDLEFRPQ
ncbi:MAG: xanthine phosphoribosyltransferase [Prevotellaceae bacterium]|nr:xanthine phosphoribosyltransferase [Prevotellaceae bacterium]